MTQELHASIDQAGVLVRRTKAEVLCQLPPISLASRLHLTCISAVSRQVLSQLPPKRRESLVFEDHEAKALEEALLDELLQVSTRQHPSPSNTPCCRPF